VEEDGDGELVSEGRVKVGYVKAIAKVHPNEVSFALRGVLVFAMMLIMVLVEPGDHTTLEQRLIAAGVFGALNEACKRFQGGLDLPYNAGGRRDGGDRIPGRAMRTHLPPRCRRFPLHSSIITSPPRLLEILASPPEFPPHTSSTVDHIWRRRGRGSADARH
jgi:hypothetical protein